MCYGGDSGGFQCTPNLSGTFLRYTRAPCRLVGIGTALSLVGIGSCYESDRKSYIIYKCLLTYMYMGVSQAFKTASDMQSHS